MKVRLGEVILDLMLVLAATAGISVAASQALHLTTFGFVVVAVSVALLVCANFLWDLRRQTYKKLSGLVRAIILLVFAMNAGSVLSAHSSSATVRSLLHNLFYFFLATLISMLVIDGIRQNREKQILRSVRDNGTV
jgi:hypothetical protein